MKKIISIVILSNMLLITGCGNETSQGVMFDFYKENFLFRNFDVAEDLTNGIPKEKLKKEAEKVNNETRKKQANKFSIAYRKLSKTDNNATQEKYQLFSIDFSQLITIQVVKVNGKWKIDNFKTKFFTDPDKMIVFLNSHRWKKQKLVDKKPE